MLELNVVETDLGLMGTPISKVNTGTDMYRLMFRGIPMYGRRSVLLIFQIWSVNRFHSSMIGYGMKQLNYHYDPVGKELIVKIHPFLTWGLGENHKDLARLYLIDGGILVGKKKSPNKLAQLAFWIYLELGGVVKFARRMQPAKEEKVEEAFKACAGWLRRQREQKQMLWQGRGFLENHLENEIAGLTCMNFCISIQAHFSRKTFHKRHCQKHFSRSCTCLQEGVNTKSVSMYTLQKG